MSTIRNQPNAIYLATSTTQAVAGNVIVSALYFYSTDKLLDSQLQLLSRSDLYRYDIEPILDILEQDVDYYLVVESIPLLRIELQGMKMAVSRAITRVANRLACELSISNPVFILSNKDAYGSIYNTFERDHLCLESRYTYYLNKWQHEWWMTNYFHHLNPVYGLNTNYGKLTPAHGTAILYHGPDYRLHRREALKEVPIRWVRLVEENDVWACTKDWHRKPPRWWKKLFEGYTFLHFLGEKQFLKVVRILDKPGLSRAVAPWLKKEATDIGIPARFVNLPNRIKNSARALIKRKATKSRDSLVYKILKNTRKLVDKYGFLSRISKDISRRRSHP